MNKQEFIVATSPTAFDQVTPSLQRRCPLQTGAGGPRLNASPHVGLGPQGWSIYGAQRAQPVATGGKWDALENGSNRPIGNRWQPTATVPEHGKEGVDGSSPSEGSRKFLLSDSFLLLLR
jgi:hypothetical protein